MKRIRKKHEIEKKLKQLETELISFPFSFEDYLIIKGKIEALKWILGANKEI